MAQPQLEKRTTRRFSLQLPVAVRRSESGGEVSTQTRDVSARGICFYVDTPMAAGSSLEFTLTLPPEVTLTESIRVRCIGRVVRVEQNDGRGRGMLVAAQIDRYEFLGDQGGKDQGTK